MDRHRLTSPALPVRFSTSGRGSRTLPPSEVPAGLPVPFWSRTITVSALWSLTLGIAAQLIGPERFNTLRFSLAFCTAALISLALADRAPVSNSPMEYRR